MNTVIKLLFHHDLPLAQPAAADDLLTLFAKPQPTWSRLWLSLSDGNPQAASCSTSSFRDVVLNALQKQFPGFPVLLFEPAPVTFRYSVDSFEQVYFQPVIPIEEMPLQLEPDQYFVRSMAGVGGSDIEWISKTNIHALVFNALAPLTAAGADMISINGKRVQNAAQLYPELHGIRKLPHGFELVLPHFRL